MRFDSYFRAVSYATVAAGAATLFVCGGFGIALASVFVCLLGFAWFLEGSKWQLPERVALVIVVLSIPLFYLDWKFQFIISGEDEKIGVTALTHLILFLSAVKLIQLKADRDWIFLYLIAFFEVLLAAGLSLSPAFLACLTLYLICALSTIIAFEIRKAARAVKPAETCLLVLPDSRRLRKALAAASGNGRAEVRRLPWVTGFLLALIFILALPLFFAAPRFSGSAFSRSGSGLSGFVGFSDSVNLGDIGRLQQNDRVVMRVRVEGADSGNARSLKWRGVALDTFTGRGWRNSKPTLPQVLSGEGKTFFRLGTTEALPKLTTQTFFLEPLDTTVLFAAPRALAVQGGLPFLRVDADGALTSRSHESSRLSYKVYSDTFTPDAALLRKDRQPYPEDFDRYLSVPPTLDRRIPALASEIVIRSGAANRYDIARAIESYLRDPQNYSYTLDLKAGGKDPLADFLFRVKQGHCEYFATALAVMLRTQGIASRVVNGFQTGVYNETADAYTVSQRDAHSWVEAYFPSVDAWVSFDPTPANGISAPVTGLAGRISKYAEALQVLWVEYFVGYDRQEQRSLAISLRSRLSETRVSLSLLMQQIRDEFSSWISFDRNGRFPFVRTNGHPWPWLTVAALLLLLFLLVLRFKRVDFWALFRRNRVSASRDSVVEFYTRMIRLFESRGVARPKDQTPLEFAHQTGISEALMLTVAYNNVRFGGRELSGSEAKQIEDWLTSLASDQA